MSLPADILRIEPHPVWDTRRLWSLWEMLNLVIGPFYQALEQLKLLENFSFTLSRLPSSDSLKKDINQNFLDVEHCLESLKFHCALIYLDESSDCIDRLSQKIGNSSFDIVSLAHQLTSLKELIENEASKRVVYNIKPQKAVQLRDPAMDNWQIIIGKFPSILEDVTGATYAYALDLNDACIFYLMRIAEVGLRAVARERRVKLPRKQALEWAEWHTVIVEINKAVGKIASHRRGPARDAALEFYRGATGEFEGFKDEFRNNVMHARKHYDEDDAIRVLSRVKEFMSRLATKIDESGKVQIKWGLTSRVTKSRS